MRFRIQVVATWPPALGDLTATDTFRAFPRLAGSERRVGYDGRSYLGAVYDVNCADLAAARREAIRLFDVEGGLVGGFSPKPSRVEAEQFEPQWSRPAITGRPGGSEPVRSVMVLAGEPAVVALMVGDQHRDVIAAARRETLGRPSTRFSGRWAALDGHGLDGAGPDGPAHLSFVLDAPLRRWELADAGAAVVEVATSSRHWVALIPASAPSVSVAVPERGALLATALVVEIRAPAALLGTLNDARAAGAAGDT